jgi:hypothetical protein
MVAVPIATPVTTPVVLMVAMPVLLLAHVPPARVLVRLMLDATHTAEGPAIADGNGLTVTPKTAEQVVMLLVYDITTEPALTPVTCPLASIVANVLSLLLQTPPAVASERLMMLPPSQTADGPVIAAGMSLMIIGLDV